MKNGSHLLLAEPEIEKYKDFIQEVRTELTEDEFKSIAPTALTEKDLEVMGVKQ